MRKMLFGFVSIMIVMSTLLHAEVPTKDSVTKLYVATFNRAPDAGGLNYWLNDSGLQLEGIASSFFDQPETQATYPPGSTNTEFVEAVYANLFNRAPEPDGLEYWVGELESGNIEKSVFILAVINGAQNTELGNDATILENKTIVGQAFADAGLDDVALAIEVMSGITDDYATVTAALAIIDTYSTTNEKAYSIKKTGQIISYEDYDDGYYQKGVAHSYTRDDSAKVVLDHVTGLMWQDNEEVGPLDKPWISEASYRADDYDNTTGDTATTYCNTLALGGYSDWRLPTVSELRGLIDYSESRPALALEFDARAEEKYWTSNDYAGLDDVAAWAVYFMFGHIETNHKANGYSVRCVRLAE